VNVLRCYPEWTGLHRRFFIAAVVLAFMWGCAPQGTYRTTTQPPPVVRVPPPPPPVAPPAEAARKPLPQEGKISEQDLKSGSLPSGPAKDNAKESAKETTPQSEPLGPALPDNSSLIAKITPGTSPQRAASLRLTDEGRKLLDAGDAPRALARLEKTIVIDSTNPYGYFYLAKAQNRLGRYKESLNFLDVAEARLGGDPYWLAEIHALRGENFRALGMIDKAQASYSQALRLNSGNRTASDALPKLQPTETASPAR